MKKSLITLILSLSVSAGFAQYTPQRYDSLLSVWYERIDLNAIDNLFDDHDATPDSVYQRRLSMIPSVIQLPYNATVRKYIVSFTNPRNTMMRSAFGMAEYYFPMIESELDRQGLPIELKMLTIIESALYPKAVSRAGATGMWQFMLASGRMMGLDINSFVDERMDPIASTHAACQFLKRLYDIYGDWTLAVAAYNCGSGTVNKALLRAPGAKDYWDIYPYLPAETRNYIPKLVAAIYAYTYHKSHGVEPIMPPHPIATDTVRINRMMHLEQVSSTIDVPLTLLRQLNPQYKLDIIPRSEKSFSLVLPIVSISSFIEKESEIYAKDTVYLAKYVNQKSGQFITAVSDRTTYKVKKGDVLGAIAKKHGVTVASLLKANKLKSASLLRVGQVLVIP